MSIGFYKFSAHDYATRFFGMQRDENSPNKFAHCLLSYGCGAQSKIETQNAHETGQGLKCSIGFAVTDPLREVPQAVR